MRNFIVFFTAVGRRKISISTVIIIINGIGQIQINKYSIEEYFINHPNKIILVQRPFRLFRSLIIDAKITISGSGKQSQCTSIQLSLARILILIQENIRKLFRKN